MLTTKEEVTTLMVRKGLTTADAGHTLTQEQAEQETW